ncbi:P-II family nitrogen regulator [Nigerium massiliense]|uniref:P-II family nitrogen regulator n=1 Tax=Nigerium massiliense TaxID=1522317 RepID=UPI00058D6AC3|nr:P-II family nitrogen regulator [Nigerium massiliense]
MKLVTAIVKPNVLDQVQTALIRHGVGGMTVSEVSGFARQQGHKEVYRGETLTIDFILKVRLEILTSDEDAEGIVEIIAQSARTGEVGDGKVWVTPVESAVRVRTGERGDEAL